ncbi:hypothetical protein BMS3Bbin16_00515 [archaeon BMS3Bbin16]|nr:hypothetical protein BMS3Bbin16_00515 [archaeon BMS3Bbin16]
MQLRSRMIILISTAGQIIAGMISEAILSCIMTYPLLASLRATLTVSTSTLPTVIVVIRVLLIVLAMLQKAQPIILRMWRSTISPPAHGLISVI